MSCTDKTGRFREMLLDFAEKNLAPHDRSALAAHLQPGGLAGQQAGRINRSGQDRIAARAETLRGEGFGSGAGARGLVTTAHGAPLARERLEGQAGSGKLNLSFMFGSGACC